MSTKAVWFLLASMMETKIKSPTFRATRKMGHPEVQNHSKARPPATVIEGAPPARSFGGTKGRGLDSVRLKRPLENPNPLPTSWVEVNSKPRPFQKPKGSGTRKSKTAQSLGHPPLRAVRERRARRKKQSPSLTKSVAKARIESREHAVVNRGRDMERQNGTKIV